MVWVRFVIPVIIVLSGSAFAQLNPVATPTPTPRPGSRQANVSGIIADKDSYDRLRSIESMGDRNNREPPQLLVGKESIYRKPSKSEIAALTVSDQLLAKYADFLRTKGTGLVKLSSDSSCVAASDVIVASEHCLPFNIPGAGTAFSFRTESYRLPRLADLILLNGQFKTGGVFQQVIFADIGDVAIDIVTMDAPSIAYLANAKPAVDSDEFTRFDNELLAGIENGGIVYRKNHPATMNTTFALRSLAYRGKSLRTLDGFVYNELEYDKRKDVIVVFRIVDKESNGNLTILWKKLRETEVPVLKVIKQPDNK